MDNPEGPALGFDAFDGDKLSAHYACIPVRIFLRGVSLKALLSLNTATHPDYQRQGLFTKLASSTYKSAADQGFELVYGIANQNSTQGFTRKLGFHLVAPLEARIGFGRLSVIDWTSVYEQADFRRHWDSRSISWRLANPSNPAAVHLYKRSSVGILAETDHYGISAYTELSVNLNKGGGANTAYFIPKLFLGRFPSGTCKYHKYMRIPSVLKFSPLNLIYRNLQAPSDQIDSNRVFIGFIDFDAY